MNPGELLPNARTSCPAPCSHHTLYGNMHQLHSATAPLIHSATAPLMGPVCPHSGPTEAIATHKLKCGYDMQHAALDPTKHTQYVYFQVRGHGHSGGIQRVFGCSREGYSGGIRVVFDGIRMNLRFLSAVAQQHVIYENIHE